MDGVADIISEENNVENDRRIKKIEKIIERKVEKSTRIINKKKIRIKRL